MFKYIKMFFLFLLPIVRKAAIEVAADTLTQAAYPNRQPIGRYTMGRRPAPRFIDYSGGGAKVTSERPRIMRDAEKVGPNPFRTEGNPHAFGSANWHRHEQGLAPAPYHDVLMVAFDITGRNMTAVHEFLMMHMPETKNYEDMGINLDSWWIADDDAQGDLDSVVFVSKGNQEAARGLLREHGLVG